MKRRTLPKRSQGTPRRRALVESLETRVMLTAVYDAVFGVESQKQDDDAKLVNPSIFLIFWGSYWGGTDSPQAVAVENAAKRVADSTFAQITAQYGAGPNISIDPRYQWDSGNPGNPFDSGNIDDVIQNQIDNDHLPEPDDDSLAHTPIYVVVTPPGVRSDTADAIGFNTTGSDYDPPFDVDTIPECWVGTSDDGSGGVAIDGFTQTFSHEIAECMTDTGGDGFKVNKGATWNGKGDDQIGDREGNAYYFRMLNGAAVQPVWSRADQAWAVDDGADQVWNFHPNWTGDSFNGNFDLTINGDQNANKDDYVVIDSLPGGGFLVYMNGEELHLDKGYVNKFTLNTGAGNNVVELRGATNVATTIDGAGGTLTVKGSNDTNVWFVTGANSGSIGSEQFKNVTNLDGGTGVDDFVIGGNGSISGSVDGEGGSNGLNYNNISATPVTVNLEAQTATGIGHFDHISQLLGSQTFQDTLVGDGLWTISGQNSGTVGGVTYQSFENLTGGILADEFKFLPAGQVTGNLDGGLAYNTLNYSALGATGSAFVNFSSHKASQIFGTFSDILNVVGTPGGFDGLAGPAGGTTWDINHLNMGSTSDFDFTGFERIAGGAGDDRFAFHTGGSISGGIDGGSGGNNTLDYSDVAGPITVDFNLGTASLAGSISNITNVIGSASGNDTIVGPDALWRITGANSGDVNGITFTSIENLTGSPDADTFVFLPGGSISGNLDGGAGNNVVDYSNLTTPVTIDLSGGPSTGVGGSLSNITTLIAGSGQNNIIGPSGPAAWNVIGLNTVQVAGTTFTHVQSINAGIGDNTFTFNSDGKLDGLIDGGGGNNTLSYAASTGDVVVNLRRHEATRVAGGVFNVQNAIGGQGNSMLVGDGGANTLRGGSGRSVLIGGLGNDALYGGGGDNLLIGDATMYDTDAAALAAIFREWNRTDASFQQRVAHLLSVGSNGLNGAFTLNKSAIVSDDAADSLIGSGLTLDWFIADKALDLVSGTSPQDHTTLV